jgi:hypothetical protein
MEGIAIEWKIRNELKTKENQKINNCISTVFKPNNDALNIKKNNC